MTYELKLKNEVLVTEKNLLNIFKKKEVFVLGYGSLLHSKGWFNRGMIMKPGVKDLKECVVHDYERGTYGIYDYSDVAKVALADGLHFYGVVENPKSSLNGVIAKIYTCYDWEQLMYTECIAGFVKNYNYRVVDITDKISGVKLKKNQVVHMVVNEQKNKQNWINYLPSPLYYTRVAAGVKNERSKKFQKMFNATGGLTHDAAASLYRLAEMLYY